MSLTAQDISSKNYTYVSVVRRSEVGGLLFEDFLVPSPYKEEALSQAKEYVAQRTAWLLSQWGTHSGACRCCGCYHLYPRNYVRKARRAFSEGRYL
jgi:hypothetical protein